MPSVVMTDPIYKDEALVSLRIIHPPPLSMPHPHRRIFMSRTRHAIPIGRTSKRNTAFAAAQSNGYLDSAVMSREHALLRFDPKTQKITLTDVGSLHGSFANDVRLGPNENYTLQTGDIIQFGIPIERGNDVYSPCTIQVFVEFGYLDPSERTMVFSVPDETDIDELSSDDDIGVENSSQILKSNFIRPAFCGKSAASVDMTCTEHNGDQDDDVIEVTSREKTMAQDDNSSVRSRDGTPESAFSRMPTPPETIEVFDDEALFTQESSDEDSDDNDDDLISELEDHEAAESGSDDEQIMTASMAAQPTLAVSVVGLSLSENLPDTGKGKEYDNDAHEETAHSADDFSVNLVGMERDAPSTSQPEPMDIEDESGDDEAVLNYTSAYELEVSKRIKAKQDELRRISEGVDGTPPNPSLSLPDSRPNKRKAREISDEAATEETAKETPKEASTISHANEAGADYEEMRSPKRLRRVAEAFGYAALGGVAVMSALIATAPSL